MLHLKHTIRNLVRRPVYSVVSIIGLAIAFATVIVIYLNVSYLASYDSIHSKKDRIYRLNARLVTKESENFHAKTGPALGPALKAEMPEIEEMFRLVDMGKRLITISGKEISLMENMHMADESLLDVFTIPLLHGDKEHALADPTRIMISESLADKLFGQTDVVGKTIEIDKDRPLTISAVMKDMPPNTHHQLHLVSRVPDMYNNLEFMLNARGQESHWMPHCYTFILLHEKAGIESVRNKFPQFYDKHMAAFGEKIHTRFELLSIPLTKLHFSRHLDFDQPKGIYTYVYIFTIAGIFILLTAGINYTNLFSSTLVSRSKNLGIQKITGAKPYHLIKSLVGESSVILTFSLLIGLLIAFLVFRQFKHLLIFQGNLQSVQWISIGLLLLISFVVLLTISGLPIVGQSKRNPMVLLHQKRIIRGKTTSGFNSPSLMVQLTLAVALIVASIMISKQLHFLMNTDMGFDKNNVVLVKLNGPGITTDNIGSFKQELLKSPLISGASFSTHMPGEELNSFHIPVTKDGSTTEAIAYDMRVDNDYFDLMDMEITNGRNFNKIPEYSEGNAIINESMMKKLGLTSSELDTVVRNNRIVGIIKNVHFNSLHSELKPIAYLQATVETTGYMNVKLSSHNVQEAVSYIRSTYSHFFPQLPYNLTFMDDAIKSMYANDIKHGIYLNVFSFLSVFIASIGLLGISMLAGKNQIKEIGIRKVNGAQSGDIIAMLNKKYVKLVLLATIVACPLAYLAVSRWLQNFAYQTTMSWWIFLLAGFLTLLITLLTVSWQSWNTARRNPVEALRYE